MVGRSPIGALQKIMRRDAISLADLQAVFKALRVQEFRAVVEEDGGPFRAFAVLPGGQEIPIGERRGGGRKEWKGAESMISKLASLAQWRDFEVLIRPRSAPSADMSGDAMETGSDEEGDS